MIERLSSPYETNSTRWCQNWICTPKMQSLTSFVIILVVITALTVVAYNDNEYAIWLVEWKLCLWQKHEDLRFWRRTVLTQEKHKMLKSQQIRASMIYKFCLNTTCVRLNVAAIQESEECSSYYYSNFTLYSVLSFYFGHCLRRSQHLPQWKSRTGNHMCLAEWNELLFSEVAIETWPWWILT